MKKAELMVKWIKLTEKDFKGKWIFKKKKILIANLHGGVVVQISGKPYGLNGVACNYFDIPGIFKSREVLPGCSVGEILKFGLML